MLRVMLVLLVGCVDIETPLPIDGRTYVCTVNTRAGEFLMTVEACGPWTDGWREVTAEVQAEYPDLWVAECNSTNRSCARGE